MKVLLALDNSGFSEAALGMVISQQRAQETEVRVLHVMEPLEFFFSQIATMQSPGYYPPQPIELEEVRKDRLQQAQRLVAGAAERLQDAGFRVESSVCEGDPRAEIIDRAEDWHADLIVLGSHGRKGLTRFLLGSVSEYVARHASCSVEIVRMPSRAPGS
jgi:nucleotide-binding universal stress UspA family protein